MNSSSSDNCTVAVEMGVPYSLVFLLGFLINAAALWAFIANRKLWTTTHIYMLNMNIADFLLILFLPFRIYDAFFCIPVSSFCTFLTKIYFLNMYVSIMVTAAISVHRFLAVRFPLQVRSWRWKKVKASVVCLFIWGLVVMLCAIFWKESSPDDLWTCYMRKDDQKTSGKFVLVLILMGFVAPLSIVVFCSSQIIYMFSKADDMSEEKKRIVQLVIANMIVFIACYTPIHVAFLVDYFSYVPQNWKFSSHVFETVSELIAATNCCFDSISYYFLLKSFILIRWVRAKEISMLS
ncbi:G-protein coupled receptor 35 isoform 1-T2 [Pholidichthys leucotaenia]